MYIYKLGLKRNNTYIGITKNLQSRMSSHFNGKGAKFTKLYPPVDIQEVCTSPFRSFKDTEPLESILTLRYMLTGTWQSVRGGCMVAIKDSTIHYIRQNSLMIEWRKELMLLHDLGTWREMTMKESIDSIMTIYPKKQDRKVRQLSRDRVQRLRLKLYEKTETTKSYRY